MEYASSPFLFCCFFCDLFCFWVYSANSSSAYLRHAFWLGLLHPPGFWKHQGFLFTESLFALNCRCELYRNFTNRRYPVCVVKQLPAAFDGEQQLQNVQTWLSGLFLQTDIFIYLSLWGHVIIFKLVNRIETHSEQIGARPEAGHMTAAFHPDKASILSICAMLFSNQSNRHKV